MSISSSDRFGKTVFPNAQEQIQAAFVMEVEPVLHYCMGTACDNIRMSKIAFRIDAVAGVDLGGYDTLWL